MTEKAIQVDYIARVEGEGALKIKVKDGNISELQLRIFEPPRFFQGFLVGRRYDEVPGIVSRICGICPASHQITAIQALEDALGIEVSQQTRDLRLLLALSQWIQSHTLHIYFLALPDFLGYESAIAMAKDHLATVQRALELKRLGNDLTMLVGGREVHPVTPAVGGFTSVPGRQELQAIGERLAVARADALATIDLVASLSVPSLERDTEHVALSSTGDYAVNGGRLVSTKGLNIPAWQYRSHIKERHLEHSNALHSYIEGRSSFLVGPLARVNLNLDKLTPAARKIAREIGVFPTSNPFYSALARSIELLHSIDACLALIDGLDPRPDNVPYTVQAGQGFAITEAPRGVLYHSYRLNNQGLIEEADIVTPTAHNVASMEEDLRVFAPGVLDLPLEEATLKCEMVIRNYDPCISCSIHFLRLEIERE
ncbi:Ni/Fe hydrogenase subunit alpha [Moorella sulfitireducens (nom. illeg.)]|uniref:Ni/Fe hydrogenase subunit alpha n=1 Tax=Neomoorella sulfitireducens TaxID=2972948 RepID=UPI0021AC7106|nr:Ni/Fe hydrogenase subunit alpha [Moorella sulfitireducens]